MAVDELDDLDVLDVQRDRMQATGYVPVQVSRQANSLRSLLLLTIPKCGTTWMRYLLVNYGRLLNDPRATPVAYHELAAYTVEREFLLSGKQQFTAGVGLIPDSGLDYLLYQHIHRRRFAQNVWAHLGRKIAVVRNPLDFLISCYYFFFVNRDARRGEASHPRDILPAYTRYYGMSYMFLRDKVLPAGDAVTVSYEALKRNGPMELSRVLLALNLPVDDGAVDRAVQFSDQSVVREQEQSRGRALVAPLDRGAFVRDGSVGQWRDYLEEQDVMEVRSILRSAGIDLDTFDLGEDEPPAIPLTANGVDS